MQAGVSYYIVDGNRAYTFNYNQAKVEYVVEGTGLLYFSLNECASLARWHRYIYTLLFGFTHV